MTNKAQINAEEIKIQGLLDSFLRNSAKKNFTGEEDHLEDDQITAFIEGKSTKWESPAIIKHLIECSFCLHVTGELAKLNTVFAEDEELISAPAKEPAKFQKY